MTSCKVEGCGRRIAGRGYCRSHYQRARRFGEFGTPPCSVDECKQFATAKKLCPMHYERLRKTGATGPAASHYQQVRFGGRSLHKSTGYMRNGSLLEHRRLMEGLLGRPLLPTETVHHVNTIKTDNWIDGPLDAALRSGNLQLWASAQPSGGRVVDLLAFAIELVGRYTPELLNQAAAQRYLAEVAHAEEQARGAEEQELPDAGR